MASIESGIYDAIVVGVGAHGSASMFQLAKRGCSVIGRRRRRRFNPVVSIESAASSPLIDCAILFTNFALSNGVDVSTAPDFHMGVV